MIRPQLNTLIHNGEYMIPKLLHYVWLGSKKNELVHMCIDSFHKYMNDYRIIEWNESNIDISTFNDNEQLFYNKNYKAKKYAFCSDLVRLHVLKDYGGVYVDTDVEFIKHMPDEFLNHPIIARINPNCTVCNGCIWGCEKDDSLVLKMINEFSNKIETSFKSHGKTWIFNTLLKDLFNTNGDTNDNSNIISVLGYKVYPTEYFCPMNSRTKEIHITNNTISIHHFDSSWKG